MKGFASLCTEQIAQSERLAKWRECVSINVGKTPDHIRRLESTNIEPRNEGVFRARLECGDLGALHFCRLSATPHRFSRSLSRGIDFKDAPVLLVLQTSGTSVVGQGGHACTLNPHRMALLDSAQSFEVTTTKAFEQIILLCNDLRCSAIDVRNVLVNCRNGLGQMLHRLIVDACEHYSLLSESSARAIGDSIRALLVDAVGQAVVYRRDCRMGRSLKTDRIKSFIEDHLAEHELNIERIAQATKCSVRSVHRAFENEVAGGVSDYMWRRRLSRCAEDLSNEACRQRSISDIACRWGFISSSHFSRSFKQKYGVSPTLFRAATRKSQSVA